MGRPHIPGPSAVTPTVKDAFDRQPLMRLVAAKAHLRGYTVNMPRHSHDLCHWLASRGVDGQGLIEAYRTASEGQVPNKPVCTYEGPTPARVAFARRLLQDLTEYLDNGVVL